MDHAARIDAVQERLEADGRAALVVTGAADCLYLSGFHATADDPNYPALVVPQQGNPTLLVSKLDVEHAQRAAAVDVAVPDDGFVRAVADRLPQGDSVVTSGMGVGFYHRLAEERSLHLDDSLLTAMKAVKDDDEVAQLREAYRIAEDAIDTVADQVETGMTEREVAAELEYAMRRNGADGTAFPTIVGTGAFTALPHHRASDTAIDDGPLLFDLGAAVDGYMSDVSRMYHVGQPSDQFREVYAVVREAQQAAVDALHAGVACRTVDAAARDVIEDAGYGDQFMHSTGHGVGLAVHEQPNLSHRNDQELRAGHVVTVEPGIYLRGDFGIRIEDAYVVREDGADRLTTSDRDLRILHL